MIVRDMIIRLLDFPMDWEVKAKQPNGDHTDTASGDIYGWQDATNDAVIIDVS